jgi:hypothetical protein
MRINCCLSYFWIGVVPLLCYCRRFILAGKGISVGSILS